FEPGTTLAVIATSLPESPQRGCHAQSRGVIALTKQPGRRGRLDSWHSRSRANLERTGKLGFVTLHAFEQHCRMTGPQCSRFTRNLEHLKPILANWLQHPIPSRSAVRLHDHHRLVDESRHPRTSPDGCIERARTPFRPGPATNRRRKTASR